MEVGNVLERATKKLEASGIGTARLDTLVLLEDVTRHDRAWLLARPDHELSSSQVSILTKLLNRRARHEPLAYVRQKTEFYGREFIITSAVLEPRPESETMIDLLKKLPALPKRPRIADIGTGSGALGITAQLELTDSRVTLLELDGKALKIAQKNVDKYTMHLKLHQGDLLEASQQYFDILLCNLPYVPDDHQVNQAARHEPDIAIFGGPDGLDLYRRLFDQIKKRQNQPLFILTESLPPQHAALKRVAEKAGYQLAQSVDFIQVFQKSGDKDR